MNKLIKYAVCASMITSSVAMAADKVTFQLDWLPGADSVPVYVGLQEGFFEEENLAVSISSGRGSTDAITKLATGNSDIGNADIGALMAAKAQDNVPVVAVLPYFTQAPHTFFTLKSSGISSIKDLKGKKVVTSPFSSSNGFLPVVLKEHNLKEDDIKLIKTDPGTLGPMMVTGKADAVIGWATNSEQFKEQAKSAGKEVLSMPWSNEGLSLYSFSLLASEQFLKERPEVAKRFVKAFKKSIEFAYANPEKAGEAIHAIVPEVDAESISAQVKSVTNLVYNDITKEDGFGVFTLQRINQTWKYVALANALNTDTLDPLKAVSFEYVPE
ncbi:ABC transporter substrate-binding protein [Psychromonas sp.]|uniref:ABC transporter substrate-binding protein n=1 Tax=Psychromonas sp. TaxID=1884585 RepID=UPI003A979165